MAWLPYVRLLKLLAVAVYSTGTLGGLFARSHGERRRFALLFAGPGLLACWLLGFVVAGLAHVSYLSPFILWALGSSAVSLNALLYRAGREGRGGALSWALALGGFGATLALMVLRPA